MGFIFGIIDLHNHPIHTHDIHTLSQAVQWDGFEDRIETGLSYALGYCWNSHRKPKAEIYRSEQLVLVCDARIYNTSELRGELEFSTPGEAFAKAYLKWGVPCANRFSGDFSVVIMDFVLQKVILFRDHVGVRPLCYFLRGNRLIFASHEFGIAQSHLTDNTLSEEALVRRFFRHKKQEYRQTAFKNIQKVLPGHCLTISLQKEASIKYWHPEGIKKNDLLSFTEATSQLRYFIIEATMKRMEDGQVGVHVSGGIDSSGIASILADHIGKKQRLTGYSWSPKVRLREVDGVDENSLIEDFAEQKKVTVRYCIGNEDTSIDDFMLPEFENMSIELQTMRQAYRDDIKVLYSGWGGDEFVSLSIRGSLNHIVFRFKFRALIRWIQYFGLKSTISRAMGEILPLFIPFGLMESSSIKRSGFHYFKKSFIFKHWRLFFFNKNRFIYGFGNRTGFMLNLYRNHYLADRMDSWSLFGEKYGIEYKYPLLDKQLLEFWLSVPVRHTYESMIPRQLYREAMKDILPESIRMRTNKQEEVFQQYNTQHKLRLRTELAQRPELFSEDKYLPFFKQNEFENLLHSTTDNRKEINRNHFDLSYYLRYRKLCEKYLTGHHIITEIR